MELILKYFPNLTAQQIRQFGQLQALYDEWNERINVVSRKDIDSLYLHHVLHSLAIANVVNFVPRANILDVGTGGGFPAIPLAILFPQSQFTAIDTIGKKIKVVDAVVEGLGLTNVKAMQIQAEQVLGSFDFVLARAVTNLSAFLPWVWNKVRKNSLHALPNGIICLKGGELRQEIDEAVKRMNIAPSQVMEYAIADFFKEDFFESKKVIYIQR